MFLSLRVEACFSGCFEKNMRYHVVSENAVPNAWTQLRGRRIGVEDLAALDALCVRQKEGDAAHVEPSTGPWGLRPCNAQKSLRQPSEAVEARRLPHTCVALLDWRRILIKFPSYNGKHRHPKKEVWESSTFGGGSRCHLCDWWWLLSSVCGGGSHSCPVGGGGAFPLRCRVVVVAVGTRVICSTALRVAAASSRNAAINRVTTNGQKQTPQPEESDLNHQEQRQM